MSGLSPLHPKEIDLRNVSLNQLRIFIAVLDTGRVAHAGQRFNLTSSAVSHSLARLREAVGDELFIRRGNNLEPTPRARQIADRVRPLLNKFAEALADVEFDPGHSRLQFNIIASPHAMGTLLPELVKKIQREAPGIRISLTTPLHCDVVAELAAGRADLALGLPNPGDERLEWTKLFADHLVWVARTGHPAIQAPTLPAIINQNQRVLVETLVAEFDEPPPLATRSAEQSATLEALLLKLGFNPATGVRVPDTASALAIVANSDLIALLPKYQAERLGGNLVQIFGAPDKLPTLHCGLCWRKDRGGDAALDWMLGVIRQASTIFAK